MTILDYLDALAGTGKTRWIAIRAHRWAILGFKVLIVQPSKLLIAKTVSDELAKLSPVRHKIIDGDHSDEVIASIVAHFRDTPPGGEILFITHSAFFQVPFFAHRDQWIVLMDEVPKATDFHELPLPANSDLFLPHLQPEAYDAKYALLTAAPGHAGKLRKISRNVQKDAVWQPLSPLASILVNKNWSTYVEHSRFEDLRLSRAGETKLTAYSTLNPAVFQGFRRVIIAGACFKESILYRLWTAGGIEFRALKADLRYNQHQNGHLLRILYATDEPWSKTLRKRSSDNGTVRNEVVAKVQAELGAEPFLWMDNKDLPDDVFDLAGAKRLPNSPHGLNIFQSFDHTVVLSALNPTPGHFAFLESRGLPGDDVRTAISRAATYQAAMRSSLRNPDSTSSKTVIVMDRATAEWLSGLFPGSSVSPLGGKVIGAVLGKPGRPRRHQSDADRKKAHHREKEIQLLIGQAAINGEDLSDHDYPELVRTVVGQMSELRGVDVLAGGVLGEPQTSAGTVFESKYDTAPLAHADYGNHDAFIASLKVFHSDVIKQKEDAGLISPAHFDPDMSEATSRGLENVRHIRGIWLDNDGGDLSPERFSELFPSLRMACWNTFSSTPEKRRWRAFIPTTQAMSKEVHGMILGQIVKVLNQRGYWSKEDLEKRPRAKTRRLHGFDRATMTASALYYLPSQAKHPAGSFFLDFADQKRRPLEPYAWIKRSIIHPEPEPVVQSAPPTAPPVCGGGSPALKAIRAGLASKAQQSSVAGASRRWRAVAMVPGQGHKDFFKLGVALRAAGLDDFAMGQALRDEAQYARSPEERLREVREIIKSLPRL